LVGRIEQLHTSGRFITCDVAEQPIVVVRGTDDDVRAFFNVCRHHAAAVATEAEGSARYLRCPYHGWTYSLEGELKGTPDFSGACDFDRAANGLVPVALAEWEKWVLIGLESASPPLAAFLGDTLRAQIGELHLERLSWMERRHYFVDCNWKVFVDNYLDGGYHVPYLHHDLDSVLDYSAYTIENGERHCLQASAHAHARTGAVLLGLSQLHAQLVRHRDGYEPRWCRAVWTARKSSSTSTSPTCPIRLALTISPAWPPASRSRMRTLRSASRSNAVCGRVPIPPAACPRDAKRASTCFTGCSIATSRQV
jgi:nitrite reductase/ring-hydroxylating ferredoxin subunit